MENYVVARDAVGYYCPVRASYLSADCRNPYYPDALRIYGFVVLLILRHLHIAQSRYQDKQKYYNYPGEDEYAVSVCIVVHPSILSLSVPVLLYINLDLMSRLFCPSA